MSDCVHKFSLTEIFRLSSPLSTVTRNFQNPISIGSIVTFAFVYVSRASLAYCNAPSSVLFFFSNSND